MKTILHAAMAALSISSISPAIADEGDCGGPNTYFTSPSGVIARAPQQATATMTAQRCVSEQPCGAVHHEAVLPSPRPQRFRPASSF
jgi:hypothetical protein